MIYLMKKKLINHYFYGLSYEKEIDKLFFYGLIIDKKMIKYY